MQKVTEQQIQKAIIDYLKLKKFIVFKHRNVGIYKQDTGSYIPLPCGERGISDIIGCSSAGRFVAIEVKKPGGKASPDQKDFLARIEASGGIALLAYSLDEVLNAFEGTSRGVVPIAPSKVHKNAVKTTQSCA